MHHRFQNIFYLRPPKSTTHLATFLIDCIETRGVVGHLPPTLWKVGGGGTYFTFYGKHFISNWIFSIKEKNVKLTRDLKPFFLFAFFLFFLFVVCCILLVSFSSFPFLCTPKAPPTTFRSISKALSSSLYPFVTPPLHMHNVQKTSDWKKGGQILGDLMV